MLVGVLQVQLCRNLLYTGRQEDLSRKHTEREQHFFEPQSSHTHSRVFLDSFLILLANLLCEDPSPFKRGGGSLGEMPEAYFLNWAGPE